MKRKWMYRLWAALCALALMAPARAEEAPTLMEPAGVKLATAAARADEISKLTVYDGSVVPYVEDVSFAADGEIAEICVVVGQQVKAGDVLMTLNRESADERCSELQEEIAALETGMAYDEALAQIDLRLLELERERLGSQSPRDEQAIALKRLDIEAFELNRSLEAELDQLALDRLRGELAQLEDESQKAVMTAPFDGTVMFLADVAPGDHASAYSPLVYLADDSRLSIESDYISAVYLENADDLYALVGGDRVEINPIPMDQSEYIALVLAGESAPSRFEITSEAAGLSAGQYAAVCVENGRVEDALVIPANALYSGSEGRYVYVVEDGERVHRAVKVGVTTSWEVQILQGLEEGELVYVPD